MDCTSVAVTHARRAAQGRCLESGPNRGGGGPNAVLNYLVIQAKQNLGPFMALLGKVLPTQVSDERGQPRR